MFLLHLALVKSLTLQVPYVLHRAHLTVSDIVITYYPQYCYPLPLSTALFPFYFFMLPLVNLDVLIPVILHYEHITLCAKYVYIVVYLYTFPITLDRLV